MWGKNKKNKEKTHKEPKAPLKTKRQKHGAKIGRILIYILIALAVSFAFSKFQLWKYVDMVRQMAKLSEPKKEEKVEKELPLVKVFHVVRTNFSDNLPMIGTVRGYEEIEMRFEANGVIERIHYNVGDLVAKGDLVANLDQSEAKYRIEYQQANYETAQSTFLGSAKKLTNAEKMFEVGAIVVSKLDEAVLEAENAALKMKSSQFEYLSAKNEMKKTELHSPVSGVLASRYMDEGEFVTSNEKVLAVMDLSKVYVEVGIVEKDVDKIAIGLPAKISVDTYPGVTFDGVLTKMSPVIEGKSRTLTVKIEVSNDQLMLLPGMFVRSEISVYDAKDTIMIPALALNKGKDGYTVNVVNAEDTIQTRPVEVIYFSVDREYVEVKGGLDVDEFVVIESHQEMKEGDKVQVIEVQESPFVESSASK